MKKYLMLFLLMSFAMVAFSSMVHADNLAPPGPGQEIQYNEYLEILEFVAFQQAVAVTTTAVGGKEEVPVIRAGEQFISINKYAYPISNLFADLQQRKKLIYTLSLQLSGQQKLSFENNPRTLYQMIGYSMWN